MQELNVAVIKVGRFVNIWSFLFLHLPKALFGCYRKTIYSKNSLHGVTKEIRNFYRLLMDVSIKILIHSLCFFLGRGAYF